MSKSQSVETKEATNESLTSKALRAELEHLHWLEEKRVKRLITPFIGRRIDRQIARVEKLYKLLDCC